MALLQEHSFLLTILGQCLSPISASCQGACRTAIGVGGPSAAFPPILFSRKQGLRGKGCGERKGILQGYL